MSGHDDARWFLEQLRAATAGKLGPVDPLTIESVSERLRRESISPQQRDEAELIDAFARQRQRMAGASQDDTFADMFAEMLTVIEGTIVAQNPGVDLSPLRPLVGHLQTGQLNAVTMRVPMSDTHLVLVEDQMPLFASKLSKAFAWAVPREQGSDGMHHFRISGPDVAARLDGDPSIAERFTEIVLHYAAYGVLNDTKHHLLPNGWFNFASTLRDGLEYFVLGHEYAHVLCNHLGQAESRRGVLPLEEAEAFAWDWRQELEADALGTVMALNAMGSEGVDAPTAFMGISLFFDAMDVFDRAVSLLLSGNEQSYQVGSHPPAAVRKQRLAEHNSGAAAAVSAVVDALWQRARPQILAMHQRGVRPAPTWRAIPKEVSAVR
ncbi:hypothetical protein [Paractinoplanes atraurantiacus]|uniref:Peptidase family M48 n=1 Tax=Paractinoplanes atraurantiacus TaxID=1036182 RepID=A0A285JY54_9ACTN|nr:hypothetical protein [Actinoplanes atraurantiacus]SNY64001.1 hypothetical protein SAMN05421748_12619 [Actinoplanes atraurantiacus]